MQSALATTHLLQPSARKTLRALNRGKICAPCMFRGVSAAKRAPPWQDMRVVYPPAAICGAFRIHGAHILPMPARFGYMAAICCQGGALFPPEAPSGMHEARNLPLLDVGERIASIYCRSQALGNAFREHPAVAEQPKAHLERTLPWHRPPWNASRIRTAMPGCLRTNRSRILPTKPPFSCAKVQDARSRHGASQTRGAAAGVRSPPRARDDIGDRPAGRRAVSAIGPPVAGLYHGARDRRRRTRTARWAQGGIGAHSHGSGTHTHRRTVCSPDSGLVQVCAASERSRPLRARRPLEHGGRQRRACPAAARGRRLRATPATGPTAPRGD